jgi:3-dehydroquinate dehydratase-2
MDQLPLVFLLNGPNANLYGLDADGPYGRTTLADIEEMAKVRAATLGFALECRQSNHEGLLIDWIQEAREAASGIIINAASLTYTSIGLLDALLAFRRPVFEVHMTNIHKREPFRHHSFISKAATGIIAGFGPLGYELAVVAMARQLNSSNQEAKA